MNIRRRYLINNLMYGLVPILLIVSIFFSVNNRQAQKNIHSLLEGYITSFKENLLARTVQSQDYAFFITRIARDNLFRRSASNDLNFPVNIEDFNIRLFEVYRDGKMLYRDTYSWKDSKYFMSEESADNIWKELSGSQYTIWYKTSYPEIVSNVLVVRSCSIYPDDRNEKTGFAAVSIPLDYDYLSQLPLASSQLIYYVRAGDRYVFSDQKFDNTGTAGTLLTMDMNNKQGYAKLNLGGLGTYICYQDVLYSKPSRVSNRIVQQTVANVGVLYSYDAVLKQFFVLEKIALFIVAIGLVVVFATSFLSAHYDTSPILQLKREVEQFESTMKPVVKPSKVNNEILSLRKSVAEMSEKILYKTIENELERQQLREKNRTLDNELEIARTIQMKLIPQKSPLKNIAYYYKPMEKIGGDFFDFIELPNGQIGIFISDVSGHGIPAAFYTSIIKSFSSQAFTLLYDPALYLYELNDFLFQFSTDFFVTAIYGVYDPSQNTFVFCNAGHNPLIGIDRDGDIRYIEGPRSAPLAVFSNRQAEQYNQNHVKTKLDLGEFSKILFYTDGLTEAVNYEKSRLFPNAPLEMFEDKELLNTLKDCRHLSAEALLQYIVKKLGAFRESSDFDDDICMICIENTGK